MAPCLVAINKLQLILEKKILNDLYFNNSNNILLVFLLFSFVSISLLHFVLHSFNVSKLFSFASHPLSYHFLISFFVIFWLIYLNYLRKWIFDIRLKYYYRKSVQSNLDSLLLFSLDCKYLFHLKFHLNTKNHFILFV